MAMETKCYFKSNALRVAKGPLAELPQMEQHFRAGA